MQAQTLETLKTAGFNKIRMGVFPKDYPITPTNRFTPQPERRRRQGGFRSSEPVMFRHFERQVAALCALGIEADIIMFHYDRWGYADMSAESRTSLYRLSRGTPCRLS